MFHSSLQSLAPGQMGSALASEALPLRHSRCPRPSPAPAPWPPAPLCTLAGNMWGSGLGLRLSADLQEPSAGPPESSASACRQPHFSLPEVSAVSTHQTEFEGHHGPRTEKGSARGLAELRGRAMKLKAGFPAQNREERANLDFRS